MTKQDKVSYKNPIAQNLFLLAQNKDFLEEIKRVEKKYKKELDQIAQMSSTPFVAQSF